MKVVILAGGFGTRISEESHLRPKPMVEIGQKPILWHIMKLYSYYGYCEFIICAGYKQYVIKDWFMNYFYHNSDVTLDFSKGYNAICTYKNTVEPWKITIADTGEDTFTGGRVKRIKEYIGDETFFLTYGDGLSDININKLLCFHQQRNVLCTLTAVKPEGRFGVLDVEGNCVCSFREKSKNDMGWINGGFMVVEPQVIDYIRDDTTIFEKEPLERLAKEGNLNCYKHEGFWKCIDTLKDKKQLETLLDSGKAPWKVWDRNV